MGTTTIDTTTANNYNNDEFEQFLNTISNDYFSSSNNKEEEAFKNLFLWAFNVVNTRCWRFENDIKYKDQETKICNTDIVPIGDMFNHREPPNVAVFESDDNGDNTEKNKKTTSSSSSPTVEFIYNPSKQQ